MNILTPIKWNPVQKTGTFIDSSILNEKVSATETIPHMQAITSGAKSVTDFGCDTVILYR